MSDGMIAGRGVTRIFSQSKSTRVAEHPALGHEEALQRFTADSGWPGGISDGLHSAVMAIEVFRYEYAKALRAWHVAWMERVAWHREHFFPLNESEQSVIYEEVLTQHRELPEAEERAFDRFLQARDVLKEALASADLDV
jgi:hypothetical protein